MRETESKDFAKKYFQARRDASWLEEDLYDFINSLIQDKKEKEEGFEYLDFDFFVDPYDNSIEVIFKPNTFRLNREKANEILNLGYSSLYESFGEETGINWLSDRENKCSAVKGSGTSLQRKAFILEKRVKELESIIEHEKEAGIIPNY